jgi:hypothetical protein
MVDCWIPMSMVTSAFSKRNLTVDIPFEMVGSIYQSRWHREIVPIKAIGRTERAIECFWSNGISLENVSR